VWTPDPSGCVRKGLGKTLLGSISSTGMLLSVLISERTSLQPTSIQLRLMTGSEYSGTPLNRDPSPADTHDLMAKSGSPNCPYIHFNT